MLQMKWKSELLCKKQEPEAHGGVGQAQNWVLGEDAPNCREALAALSVIKAQCLEQGP